MHLSPKETDRLLVFVAAELARKRHAKGLRLSYPEASALITDELLEGAREGKSVAELMSFGTNVLTVEDVLPGVPKLLSTLQVEGYFPDGQKLVTVHDPIPDYTDDGDSTPGTIVVADGEIELSEGREVATVEVANTGDRPVQIGSHFHFFEVNEALRFDRDRAFGMHLDIPAGTAVRFEPGDEKSVDLVALGGHRAIHGLNMKTNGTTVRDD